MAAAPAGDSKQTDQFQALQRCKIWDKLKNGNLHDITKENVAELHSVLDTDEVGEISTSDLQMLRSVPDLQLSDQDIEDLAADCDSDGSGKVSADELYKALTLGSVAQKIIMDHLNPGSKSSKPNECRREELVEWMEHENETSSSLWSLPQTIMLFTMYLLAVDMHLDMETGYIMQDSIYTGVTGEGKPFLYAYVHDIPSFWDWMDTSFIGVHLKNDLDNFPYPGRLESYSQIVGGIQMTKTDIVPGHCDQVPVLRGFYDSISDGCAANSEAETNSTFVLYHLSNDDIKELFSELRNTLWMSLNTTEMTTTILFYNGYLGAFTFYQFTCYFGGLKENNRKDGLMHMKFSQETFKADPYYDPIHKGHLWLFLPDLIFTGILTRMFVGELKELLPALMNGLSGFIGYWDVWNVIDWCSMLLSFGCMIVWTIICINVGGPLQEQIGQLPTRQLDNIINVNRSYFSRAQLDETIDIQAYEEQIALIQDTASNIATLHADLRTMVFFNTVVLMMKFFKAFRANPRLNVVIMTMEHASIDLAHFMIVFATIFLVFANMGQIMFGTYCPQFHTFPRALMVCWRILMGEDITEDMEPAGTHWAWMWVVTFQFLVMLILLNMIVAIIMDSYMAVNGGSQLTIWKQTADAIQTIRQTRGFIDLWYMICEFNDPEEPAHPGQRVSARSLRRAFERDKMTKSNAEYLIRKTQEFLKEKEGEREIGLSEGLKIMSQVRTMVMKINSDTEKTKDMVNRQIRAPQEARLDNIMATGEPDGHPTGAMSGMPGMGGMGNTYPAMGNTYPGMDGSYGMGGAGMSMNGQGQPLAITSGTIGPDKIMHNNVGMNGQLALPNQVNSNGFQNGMNSMQPQQFSNGFAAPVNAAPLAITNVPNGGSNTQSTAMVPKDFAGPSENAAMLATGGAGGAGGAGANMLQQIPMMAQQMLLQQQAQASIMAANQMMLQHVQKMAAQMQKVQSTVDGVQSQLYDLARSAETRHTAIEQRVTTLERRVERVETISLKLRDTFQGFDFDDFMSLPRKVADTVTVQAKVQSDEILGEIAQYRTDLGRVAEQLGPQLKRERGLHELIDQMENECVADVGDLRAVGNAEEERQMPSHNFSQMHDMIDRYFTENAESVGTTLKALKAAPVLMSSASSVQVGGAAKLQQPGMDAAGSSKGAPLDAKQKRLEARMDAMTEQMMALMSHAEEQAQAMKMMWRMDMNLRELKKNGLKVTSTAPPVAESSHGGRFGQNQANRSPERRQSQSRLGTKNTNRSSFSGARNSISEAGDAIVRSATPPTPPPGRD